MLSRRILRIKAFKTVYSIVENPSIPLKEAEAQLEKSCESTRDLYLFLMDIIPALTLEAKSRMEAARAKFNPTEEERNPNLKFIENSIAPLLEQDPDFTKIISRKHISWDQYDALIRRLYESVRGKVYFKNYMADGERSLHQDAMLFYKIFEKELEDNGDLAKILEDLSIWWIDDLPYALTWCCRTMEALGKGARWNLPPLYASDLPGNEAFESDHAFVVNVVRTAHRNFENYYQQIADLTPKWDKNRICATDLALIVSGLAEAAAFPAVSPKIIINEYVEISKFYSTPESRAFVNGLLDRIINKR